MVARSLVSWQAVFATPTQYHPPPVRAAAAFVWLSVCVRQGEGGERVISIEFMRLTVAVSFLQIELR